MAEEFIPGPIDNTWGDGPESKRQKIENLAQWILLHPDFDDRPATIEEFMGPGYLDIDRDQNPNLPKGGTIREGVKAALIEIFGTDIDPDSISEKREALFTGGIGIGKTTMASVALAYMVHWVLCLHDPQRYFGLMPGSRIAFMLMSTRDSQAKEVLFGDIKARINYSQWFKNLETPWKTAYDDKIKNQLRFPKDIWVIPGNSAETTFEGYNILGGILDEGDSHKVTEEKDYADVGYRTIKARITSRFTNPLTGKHRGLLVVIGQMKSQDGFMARKKKALEEMELRGDAKVVHMSIWESFGWPHYTNDQGIAPCFYFDIDRKIIVPDPVGNSFAFPNIIRIPNSYRDDFDLDPVQALKDHAGIPPAAEDPFIAVPDRIDHAQAEWGRRYADRSFVPVGSQCDVFAFHRDFVCDDNHLRAVHVDIGYSTQGDAAGLAMGHIPEIVEIDGEWKPIIVFDFLMRIKPRGGQALMLQDIRQLIYDLRDERKFRIGVVTYDGFQSLDSLQLLRKKRFNTAELSVDRSKGPYEDLREAIYERRIQFPEYNVFWNRNDTEKVNVAKRELLGLTDVGKKIDHQPKGSKDVADAMAGVAHALSVSSGFRRNARRNDISMADEFTQDALFSEHGQIQELDPAALGQAVPDKMQKALGSPTTGGPTGQLARYLQERPNPAALLREMMGTR